MMPDCMIAGCAQQASHLCSNSTPRCYEHCVDIPENERERIALFNRKMEGVRQKLQEAREEFWR